MASATALRCEDLDDEIAQTLMVSCETCDPDNPLSVPRKNCPACRGTGSHPARLAGIMEEIKTSKHEKHRILPMKSGDDSDLYLEY